MRNFSKIAAVVFAAVAVLAISTVSFARGWEQHGGQWYYTDGSGEFVTNTIKTSGTTKYYLGDDGAMVTNTFVEDYNDYSYYFGANGAMVTNTWVAVDPAILSSADDDAPSAYWFYFGTNGKAYKANGSNPIVKKTIDGNKYIFDDLGHMLTGWIDESTGKIGEDEDDPFATATYYAGGENDGVLRKGWHAYVDGAGDSFDASYGEKYSLGEEGSGWDPSDEDVIWFYFQPSNCKKLTGYVNRRGQDTLKTKKINGKTYAFTVEGLMFEGWQFVAGTFSQGMNYKYYSKDNGGALTKKGWIFDVPTYYQDAQDQVDQEDRWFYADGSGKTIVSQTKKINNKYYIFDKMGIMKKGLILTTSANKYIAKVKLDETDGKRFISEGMFVVDDASGDLGGTEGVDFDNNGTFYYWAYGDWGMNGGASNRFFYFRDTDEGGDRQTGTLTLEFTDNDYTFVSNNSGGYMGSKNNGSKFYAQGIALKANPDVRYGIVLNRTRDAVVAAHTYRDAQPAVQNFPAPDQLELEDIMVRGAFVVTTSGSKIKKNAVKKDGNDNYWVVEGNLFRGVYTAQVKRSNGYYQFKSDFYKPSVNDVLDSSSGYGWCCQPGKGLDNREDLTASANVLPYTATNTATYGGANYYSCDVNGKTCVYPMRLDYAKTGDYTKSVNFDAASLPGFGIQSVAQDFNAVLEDDMGVDFYWADSQK